MGLLSRVKRIETLPVTTFNTGTLWDYASGGFQAGIDGKWILTGGMGNYITGIQGRNNRFKSTILGGLNVKVLGNYPGSDLIVLDTENSLVRDTSRLLGFSNQVTEEDLADRVAILNSSAYDLAAFYDYIKEICEDKMKHMTDYIVETPILDSTTGQPQRAMVPTIVMIDSLTELYSADEVEQLNEAGMDDSKSRTVYMEDGRKKSILLRALRQMCEKYGLIVSVTAATGDIYDLNPRQGKPKQFQHGKQGEKAKGVGSKFETLPGIMAQAMQLDILSMDNKHVEPRYPIASKEGSTNGKDVNKVTMVTQRSKVIPAGLNVPFVVSQSYGLLDDVTNFHYAKEQAFGMEGYKSTNQKLHLVPDKNLTRKTLREVAASSYEIRRAMELTAQLCFVRKNWNLTPDSPLNVEPKVLFDTITASNSIQMNDILNTTGVWSYVEQEREYMSVLDVVERVMGVR